MQENETGPLPYTIYKNSLNINFKLNCKTQNYENPGDNLGNTIQDTHKQISHDEDAKSTAPKQKLTNGI